MKNLNGGYVGLLMLLIGVGLIIFFIVRTDLFTGEKGSKNMIEQGTDAVDQAKAARTMIENNSKQAAEQN